MSEEINSDLLTSFSNPNYSHVSSMVTGTNSCFKDDDDDEDNSLLLLKSDDDLDDDDLDNDNCRGSNALTALADAIHSLELLTQDQQGQHHSQQNKNLEYLQFSDRTDKSSGFSSDSAFSSPTSDCSPLMRIKRQSDNQVPISKEHQNDKEVIKDEETTNDNILKTNILGISNISTNEISNVTLTDETETQTNLTQNLDNKEFNTNTSLLGDKLDNDKVLKDDEDSVPKIDIPTSPKTPAGDDDDDDRKKIVVDLLEDDDEDDNEHESKESLLAGTPEKKSIDNLNVLSPGWERCEDASGPYYWHIKTGTIQRNPPDHMQPSTSMEFRSKLTEPDVVADANDKSLTSASSNSSKPTTTKSEITTTTLPIPVTTDNGNQDNPTELELPIRFAVRSLGWVVVNEEDLTRERSSHTVNKCIVDLSTSGGRKDINDSIGKWGDGKYLYMDIDPSNLSLVDPFDLTVLNTQAIKTLRVWGVGRENARDFAYVARDRTTRAFACHVFRCDQPARHIASTLCHVCKMAVARKNNKLLSSTYSSSSIVAGGGSSLNGSRPNRLPDFDGGSAGCGEVLAKYEDLLKNSSFPTPMDEPKKVIHCHYLGTIQVSMPTGVEVLNGAIDTLNVRVPPEKWKYVDVTIAPSTITIVEHEFPDEIISECRVRFLSFLGISVKQTKLCAFIMHTAQDNFVAHVFYCEPSAGPLCKTIEAACKLRFQKCLDRKGLPNSSSNEQGENEGSQTIKIDIAEPLAILQQKESSNESINSDSHLPQNQFLVKAKSGLSRSATHLKGGMIRASSLVSESTGSIKSALAKMHIKDNMSHSAHTIKNSLSHSANVAKNSLASSAAIAKNSLASSAVVAKNTLASSAVVAKNNLASSAEVAKKGLVSSAVVVKGLMSQGASATKSGLTSTFDFLKKRKNLFISSSSSSATPWFSKSAEFAEDDKCDGFIDDDDVVVNCHRDDDNDDDDDDDDCHQDDNDEDAYNNGSTINGGGDDDDGKHGSEGKFAECDQSFHKEEKVVQELMMI